METLEKNSWSEVAPNLSGVLGEALTQSLLPDLRAALRLHDAGVPGDADQDVWPMPSDGDAGVLRHTFCPRCESSFISGRLSADRFIEAVGVRRFL